MQTLVIHFQEKPINFKNYWYPQSEFCYANRFIWKSNVDIANIGATHVYSLKNLSYRCYSHWFWKPEQNIIKWFNLLEENRCFYTALVDESFRKTKINLMSITHTFAKCKQSMQRNASSEFNSQALNVNERRWRKKFNLFCVLWQVWK